MMRPSGPVLPAMLLAAALGSCRGGASASADGSADATYDLPPGGDTVATLTLDFTATGCQTFDLATSRCLGTAPLTVRLTPVGSTTVTRFLWDFGDGTATSTERSPLHTYTLPGTFNVNLVGAGVTGSLSRTRMQFVSVAAVAVGRLCDVDAQCATGLRCLCGSAGDCGGAFSRGICTVACDDGTCTGGAACADLTLGADRDPDRTAPYQRTLCLAPCTNDQSCAGGLTCRSLPGPGGATRPWVRACFAPEPRDVGASCRAPDGKLSGAACTGGVCADLGALGLCTIACDATGGCPPETACARFGDRRMLCLPLCSAGGTCGDDPLLACQPGTPTTQALSFTLLGSPAMACAPRRCQATDDCRPAGVCSDGHCQAAQDL